MPLFITFEGVEGSGKTTQIKILDNVLKLRGFETVLTREPGGTPISDEIRRILLDSANAGMVPTCELLLYAASRAQHMAKVISPALKAKKIVLCDRFTDATIAYQGYGRGFPLDLISNLNQLAVGQDWPQLTFLLDCDPARGLKRTDERRATQKNKSLDEDRMERESIDFHKKVRDGYLALAKKYPERIVLINAEQDVETVHQQIAKFVLERLA